MQTSLDLIANKAKKKKHYRYWEDACRFYKALPRRLGRFGLEVAPDKTRIIKFTRYQKDKSGKFSFLGFEFKWGVNRSGTDNSRCKPAAGS